VKAYQYLLAYINTNITYDGRKEKTMDRVHDILTAEQQQVEGIRTILRGIIMLATNMVEVSRNFDDLFLCCLILLYRVIRII